jgi:hypothetical protein
VGDAPSTPANFFSRQKKTKIIHRLVLHCEQGMQTKKFASTPANFFNRITVSLIYIGSEEPGGVLFFFSV